MTERDEAERLAEQTYPEIINLTSAARAGFVNGYLTGRELIRAEYGRDIGSEAFELTLEQLEAERERSQKLIAALQNIRDDGYAENYITQTLREYEANK